MAPKTPAAKETKTPAAPAVSTPAEETLDMHYSKEDKANIKRLEAADKELRGDETPDELASLIEALEVEEAQASSEDHTPRTVIKGVPDKLPPVIETTEINGKKKSYPIFFIRDFNGGSVMYNELGNRISPCHTDPALKKALVRHLGIANVERRRAERVA